MLHFNAGLHALYTDVHAVRAAALTLCAEERGAVAAAARRCTAEAHAGCTRHGGFDLSS